MKKLVLLILILFFHSLRAQQFYNTYPSSLDLDIYTKTDVLELNQAYYKIETESNSAINFHADIRLIKTDANGNIIWSKIYDAGNDSSLVVKTLNKTLDGNMIVYAELSNDNVYPPIGVSMFKLDTSGTVLWSVLFPGFRAGDLSRNTIQLADSSIIIDAKSSAGLNSCLIKLDANATTVSSKYFDNLVYAGSNLITSMIQKNNQLTISFNYGEFLVTDTAFNILTDRLYNLDPVGAYLTHTVTENGDYIFVSDIIAGGQLNGKARIFRTDSSGNLKWAKSTEIWDNFTNHSMFHLFDVIHALGVYEDTSYNLVAHLMDEGGVELLLTFDSTGTYVMNKVIKGHSLKICEDGDFVFAANLSFSNSLGIFGKQMHYSINDCDSLDDVIISQGTDSASTVVTAATSISIPITLTNFPINISTTSITPVTYCPSIMGIDNTIPNNLMRVFPNPFSNEINLFSNENGEAIIYSLSGKEILRMRSLNGELKFETQFLSNGYYLLKYILNDKSFNLKLVKM